MIRLGGTSRLPMISPRSCSPIIISLRSYHKGAGSLADIQPEFAEIII